jgi:hypothetical protein
MKLTENDLDGASVNALLRLSQSTQDNAERALIDMAILAACESDYAGLNHVHST